MYSFIYERDAMCQPSEKTSKFRIPHVIQFFLLAYLISWSIWGLLIFFPETMGEMYFLIIFGAFGPFVAAAILTRLHQGKDEAKKWRRDILRWRGRISWLLVGGLGIPILTVLAHITVYAVLYRLPQFQYDPPWYWVIPTIPINVYIVFVYSSALGEEPGWQGYAMPRLLQSFSPLIACFILGTLWALWHIPLHYTPLWEGNEPLHLMLLYTIPLSAILLWLTQKARGSVMPAVFLHYASNAIYEGYLTGTDIFIDPLDINFTLIKAVFYWIIAIILIWKTRGKLGYSKETMPE